MEVLLSDTPENKFSLFYLDGFQYLTGAPTISNFHKLDTYRVYEI